MTGRITPEQYTYLLNPLRSTRIATRSGGGGKQLSYLESWDVRAHLIRIFGFCNYDAETLEAHMLYQRDVEVGQNKSPGWEVAWYARLRLVVRDAKGRELCRHIESAVGSATGSSGLGDLHDNAVKQAASDALKRCAINLGTQFGLSLYDNGARADVVRTTLIQPKGVEADTPQEAVGDDLTDEQRKTLEHSLGATPVEESTDEAPKDEGPQFTNKIDTPEAAAEALR